MRHLSRTGACYFAVMTSLNVVRENLTFSAGSRAVSGSAGRRDVEELLLLRVIGATRSGIGGDRELIR